MIAAALVVESVEVRAVASLTSMNLLEGDAELVMLRFIGSTIEVASVLMAAVGLYMMLS